MNRPLRIITVRRPQGIDVKTNDDKEFDEESLDDKNDRIPVRQTQGSPSDVELIRTQGLQQKVASTSTISSSYTSKNGLLIALGIIAGLTVMIAAPTAAAILITRNPTVLNNSTTSTNTTTYSAYWAFDNDGSDLYGVYNGTLVNGATFSNNTYVGYGFNLALNATVNQSITISSAFLNLSYTSFTIEAWIYATSLSGDKSIFSQCQCSTCSNQCLYLIIRNSKLYMGFLLNDLVGATSLSTGTWYHVAYVYDYSSQLQMVYLQGVLDGSKSSTSSYQGQNGSITIGSSYLASSAFDGYIDNLKLTTRAKSSSELLDDATLVTYFSFDGATMTQDMGPNQINGTASNVAQVVGKVGQALIFSGSTLSFFQAYGYYQLGRSQQSFSFAMWLFPYSVVGGTLVHKATAQFTGGTWCQDMMGLTYSGQIALYTNGGAQQITGPVLSTSRWTHIVYAYSYANGQTLYVNGAQYANTGSITFSSSGTIDWLTIGSSIVGCTPSPMYGVGYFGLIDEYYVYRRELSATDVSNLANH